MYVCMYQIINSIGYIQSCPKIWKGDCPLYLKWTRHFPGNCWGGTNLWAVSWGSKFLCPEGESHQCTTASTIIIFFLLFFFLIVNSGLFLSKFVSLFLHTLSISYWSEKISVHKKKCIPSLITFTVHKLWLEI